MRTLAAVLLTVTVTLAGCAAGPSESDLRGPAEWTLGGTLDRNATEQEISLMRSHFANYGADVMIMESFPLQYRATGLTATNCPEAREWLTTQAYVASVGKCSRQQTVADPEAPTSSSSR